MISFRAAPAGSCGSCPDPFIRALHSEKRASIRRNRGRSNTATATASSIHGSNIHPRKDNRREGRYSPVVNGQRMARNVCAKTEAECEVKLAALIREMKAETAAENERRRQAELAG